jgi:hypothetical protein
LLIKQAAALPKLMSTVNPSNQEATSQWCQPNMHILLLIGTADFNDSALFFGQASHEGRAYAGILSKLMTWSIVALHGSGAT